MKQHKDSGKSIIAAARKLSTIVSAMLKRDEAFHPFRMADTKVCKKAEAMSAAALQRS